MTWIRKLQVRGRSGDMHTVSLSDVGTWGCSCAKWRFAKKGPNGLKPDCHHIEAVTSAPLPQTQSRPAPSRPTLRVNAPAAVMEIGARFRNLDFDIEVMA